MIRGFIVTVLMAAIFSGLAHPLYRRLLPRVRGSRATASVLTLLIVLLLVVVPLVAFLGIVATEAVSISQSVTPWVREHLREPGGLSRLLERVPYLAQLQEQFQAYSAQIIEKLGELAGRVSSFLVNSLSAATKGTVGFLFQLFVMIYAMFFFLVGGRAALDKAMVYVPLPESDKELLLDKFVSVARATFKGTFVVGLVQGGLAGLAFAVAGIQGATFWGTVMVVLSIIPGIGTALVWVPAVIYLFAVGQTVSAVGLAVWCALVVGTVDNFLRPKLVGGRHEDARPPDPPEHVRGAVDVRRGRPRPRSHHRRAVHRGVADLRRGLRRAAGHGRRPPTTNHGHRSRPAGRTPRSPEARRPAAGRLERVVGVWEYGGLGGSSMSLRRQLALRSATWSLVVSACSGLRLSPVTAEPTSTVDPRQVHLARPHHPRRRSGEELLRRHLRLDLRGPARDRSLHGDPPQRGDDRRHRLQRPQGRRESRSPSG